MQSTLATQTLGVGPDEPGTTLGLALAYSHCPHVLMYNRVQISLASFSEKKIVRDFDRGKTANNERLAAHGCVESNFGFVTDLNRAVLVGTIAVRTENI